MTPTTVDVEARRAALRLHALAPAQRSRVLALLDPQQADRVRPLLVELQQLGIPTMAAVDRVKALHVAPAPPPLATAERLSRISPQQAAGVLAGCSPTTSAALLRGAPASWRTAVQAALAARPATEGGHKAADVPFHPQALGPRMLAALCSGLEAAVQPLPAGAGAQSNSPRTSGGFARLLRWMR
jgi:hypothetical protein